MIAEDDCRRLLEDGDRPYDYFTERNKPVEEKTGFSEPEPLETKVVKKTDEFSIPHHDHEFSNYHNALPEYK